MCQASEGESRAMQKMEDGIKRRGYQAFFTGHSILCAFEQAGMYHELWSDGYLAARAGRKQYASESLDVG